MDEDRTSPGRSAESFAELTEEMAAEPGLESDVASADEGEPSAAADHDNKDEQLADDDSRLPDSDTDPSSESDPDVDPDSQELTFGVPEDEDEDEDDEEPTPDTTTPNIYGVIDGFRLEAVDVGYEIFVPPDDFKEHVKQDFRRIRETGVVVVSGAEGSGRLTTCIHLASKLGFSTDGEARIFRCRRLPAERVSPFELVSHSAFQEGSALILENAFEQHLPLDDLMPPELDRVVRVLQKKFGLLLITTRLEEAELRHLPVADISADHVNLREILDKGLEETAITLGDISLQRTLQKTVGGAWSLLDPYFKTQGKILRFCRNLKAHHLAGKKQDVLAKLEQLAQDIAHPTPRVLRKWFDPLETYERIFAFLVVVFEGLPMCRLIDLYADIIRNLRDDGMVQLRDARDVSDERLMEVVQARRTGFNIEIEEAAYQQEIYRQIGHHSPLVWSILGYFLDRSRGLCPLEMWQVRKGLGALLGYAGRRHPERLNVVLDRLSGSDYGHEQLIASSAIEVVAHHDVEEGSSHSIEILERCAKEGGRQERWTVGATIWRVHQILNREIPRNRRSQQRINRLLRLLRSLVKLPWSQATREEVRASVKQRRHNQKEDAIRKATNTQLWHWRQDIGGCASFALARIIATHPSDAKPTVRQWLKDAKGLRPLALKSVAEGISIARPDPQWIRDLEGVFRSTLHAPQLLNSQTKKSRIPNIFETIRPWIYSQKLYPAVFQTLLRLANRGDDKRRGHLRDGLNRCWRGQATEDSAATMAACIVARSYAMDGFFIHPPKAGLGLLILDLPLLREEQYKQLARHLVRLLATRSELEVAILGRSRVWDDLETLLATEGHLKGGLLDLHPHRLLLPLLESRSEESSFVLVLTGGPIFDLDDARSLAHDMCVFQVGGNQRIEESEASPPTDEGAPDVQPIEDLQPVEELYSVGDQDDANSAEASLGEGFFTLTTEKDEEARHLVAELLDQYWSKRLLGVVSAWDGFRREFELSPEASSEEVARVLQFQASFLDEPEYATGPTDLVRRLCGAISWFARQDMRSCAGMLADWLSKKGKAREEVPLDDETGAEEVLASEDDIERCSLVAAAASKTLLRQFSGIPLTEDNPGLAALFDLLAHPLAENDADGARAMLRAVHQWLKDPGWANHLAGDVEDGRGRLLRWAEAFLPNSLADLKAMLPTSDEMAQEPSLIVEELRTRLGRLLAEGRRWRIPQLEPGQRYGLLVVDGSLEGGMVDTSSKAPAADSGTARKRSGSQYFQVAATLSRQWEKSTTERGIVPLIFVLGESLPLWIPATSGATKVDQSRLRVVGQFLEQAKASANQQSRLLGPLLERPEFNPETVGFVLVLATEALLDASDWTESPWWRRVLLYQNPSPPASASAFRWLSARASQEREFLFHALVEDLDCRQSSTASRDFS